jgi:CHAT domain-containing protein/Tfp pilus assembly protein PilF
MLFVAATATSARAQSDHPPIFDFVPRLTPFKSSDDELDEFNRQIQELCKAGKYAEALAIAKQYVALARQTHKENETEVSVANGWLGYIYESMGRYDDAEPLLERSLTLREKVLGPDHPDLAAPLNNLAGLYDIRGRYADAEPLYKRSLALREKALGPDHPDVAMSLNNLAMLYYDESRYADAAPLWERALAICVKHLDHLCVARSLSNLAMVYRAQGLYTDAELLLKHALSIIENALGPDHPDVGAACNNLGEVYLAQGHYADAEPLLKRALTITENTLGPDHPDVGTRLNNLALLYLRQGRYADAKALFERALALIEKAVGPDHPDALRLLNNLAALSMMQGDWAHAADLWHRSTGVIVDRAVRGTGGGAETLTGKRISEGDQRSHHFLGLVKMAYRLAAGGRGWDNSQAQIFETAQWAHASEAAESLAQMAARSAKRNPALAGLVRERQDLVTEWQGRDTIRTKAASQPREKRDQTAEEANAARLNAIDKRIGEIDQRLKAEFPDYAALASPAPLPLADVQALLGSDEALVLFLDTPEWEPTPEETFVWVVTKTDVRWVRSDLGTPSLQREVAALRCGLDYDGTWGTENRCTELLKTTYTESDHGEGRPLPFDAARAHELYKALFGQIDDIIRGKQLLIVPSGALTQLPFQVLITDKPDPALSGTHALRPAAWLVRRHALTVLPSVSSLKALRQFAKESHASRMLIGFGDPLLDGPNGSYAKSASEARSKQSCPKARGQRVAAVTAGRHGLLPLKMRGGRVDVAAVRSQVPLPETADELCAVARDLGVNGDEIRLGERATETEVKRLSAAGELANYRVIHFATHGALAGQIGDSSEPGLLLTPPKAPTEADDGYLSASEIAALKLDADWVILSACNTAAGGADSAEALSGLARAFFYAGARALLVSHWSVNSDAAVKLMTRAFATLKAHPEIGRAEALRRSMVELIEHGVAEYAHPAVWAPFVLVGEGGATLAPAASTSPIPTHAKKRVTTPEWRMNVWKR